MKAAKHKYIVWVLLCVAIVMIMYSLLLPILPRPRIYPTYLPRDMQNFCQLLGVQTDDEDIFCSTYIGKNMEDMNAFLKQKFANYSDIKTHFKNLKSSWWSDCPTSSINHNYDELDFNCPTPQSCEGQWYICRFVVNGSITAIDVQFNNLSGSVVDIKALNPLGS